MIDIPSLSATVYIPSCPMCPMYQGVQTTASLQFIPRKLKTWALAGFEVGLDSTFAKVNLTMSGSSMGNFMKLWYELILDAVNWGVYIYIYIDLTSQKSFKGKYLRLAVNLRKKCQFHGRSWALGPHKRCARPNCRHCRMNLRLCSV